MVGKNIIPFVFGEDKVLGLIDRTLEFFREHGQQGERFGYSLERVGVERLQAALREVLG